MKGHLRKKTQSLLRKAFLGTGFLYFSLLIHCWHSPPFLSPPPSPIERIEGYASLNISSARGRAKSQFSFLFVLPHKGRIEVFDVWGRTIYRLFIEEEEAFFVLPSKKVYWQGKGGEIVEKFLGFALSPQEMVSLLSGEWGEGETEGGEKGYGEKWNLERDNKNKVFRGQRQNVRFEVKEFFARSTVAHRIVFESSQSQGRLKVLSMNFNQPLKKDVFALTFLRRFELKTWEEIERILENEN